MSRKSRPSIHSCKNSHYNMKKTSWNKVVTMPIKISKIFYFFPGAANIISRLLNHIVTRHRVVCTVLKWSGSFFLKHNKSFRWHLGDYEKHNFFPFEGLWEERLWLLRVFTVGSLPGGRVGPGVRFVHSAYINRFLTGRLPTVKNQRFSSHRPSNGKRLCFS